MTKILNGGAVLGCVAVLGQAGFFVTVGESPGECAARAFNGEAQGVTWETRREACRALNQQYLDVRKEVMNCLGRSKAPSGKGMEYGSELHCAIQAAERWRFVETEKKLLELCGSRVDPGTVPLGVMMNKSTFYPAAETLVALRARAEVLIANMRTGDMRALTWVLVQVHGRQEAEVLLRLHAVDKAVDATKAQEALGLVMSMKNPDDLLPAVSK